MSDYSIVQEVIQQRLQHLVDKCLLPLAGGEYRSLEEAKMLSGQIHAYRRAVKVVAEAIIDVQKGEVALQDDEDLNLINLENNL